MTKPVVDVVALYAALDTKRKSKDLSWRDLATAAGVSASTLTRMAQGAHPDVEGFAKLLRWLGEPAENFFEKIGKASVPQKREDLMVVVSRHLRASKELKPDSAKALESIIEAAYKQMKELKRG